MKTLLSNLNKFQNQVNQMAPRFKEALNIASKDVDVNDKSETKEVNDLQNLYNTLDNFQKSLNEMPQRFKE